MPHLSRGSAFCGTLFALVVLYGCSTPAADDVSVGPGADSDDCAALQWFPHSDTEEPDSKGFDPDSQCSFHQWSWQAFLWLTQDAENGQPRFLSFTTPDELFGREGAIMPIVQKSNAPIGEYLQAGTDGIMTDSVGRPIYYSQYVDTVFANFVTSNNLTDTTALYDFPADSTFAPGAISLKASWKIVEDGEDVSDFFTMQSEVYPLDNSPQGIVVDTTNTESVTLALVGFHVAGAVNNHPEMIWATFEHRRNAPNVYTHQNVGDTVLQTDPVSTESFTFYAADTPLSGCNFNSTRRRLDPATQIITPATQVCREYEFGNEPPLPTDTTDVARLMNQNDANVESLNGHVLDSLSTDDVWSNYEEVGAIWFSQANALTPGDALDTDALLIGSLRLSNSTIETFTQTQSVMNNCFRCHNTMQQLTPLASGVQRRGLPAKNINISHIIVNGYFRAREE